MCCPSPPGVFRIPNFVASWIFSLGNCFKACKRGLKCSTRHTLYNGVMLPMILLDLIRIMQSETFQPYHPYFSNQNLVGVRAINISSIEESDTVFVSMLD